MDGKPTQATKPPSNVHAIPLVMNGVHQSTSKHQLVTFRTSGIYAKPGTGSYTVSCTKTPSTVITQRIHHDENPQRTRNLPNLQKNHLLREQQVLFNQLEILPNAKPNAQPSPYPPLPTITSMTDLMDQPTVLVHHIAHPK